MKDTIEILKEITLNEKIYTVSINEEFLLTGGTSKNFYKIFYHEDKDNIKIECQHQKSIRSSFIQDDFYGCASYDGTATIFHNNEYLDIIEGPETEIKSLAMSPDKKYIGLPTRGKTLWLCVNNNNSFEIDSIVEDHHQDIKGVKFHKNKIYTYSYDNTLKIYIIESGLELIQSIELQSTIWSIVVTDKNIFTAEENGTISKYTMNDKGIYILEKKEILSYYPIYSITRIKDYIAIISNRNNILLLDFDLQIIEIKENEGTEDINEINSYNELLVTGGDDGKVIIYKLNNK
ncbi:hypothetical protein SLOPH_1789 [Spraguea lophii 42_110]|uniref:Uncharacterized protein n=1 Tax=Spraguea lophii (strain 42_110) TaxID=1358809 RepID=S7XLK3_SPRLO|nr:hypothetical protein SLOPH_1789 [Spraguea lophii 42_110]